ncbi:MAG: radical SAM protein [Thermoguttaceae bacterium]|jgi:DNA repair photolyase
MEILHTSRKSRALVPSKLPCMAGMPTVNLTAGCAHQCLYCYARGYRCYPGPGRVLVYDNLLEKLRADLNRRRPRPVAIHFSPSSDLFQPVRETLDLAYDVLELVLGRGIGVVLLTKGSIPRRHMNLLAAHAPLVRVEIGIITPQRSLARLVEPGAASPETRLRQIRELLAHGVATRARLDPILPGATDDPDALHALCAALAAVGIREVSASVLFLRPAVLGGLRKGLGQGRRLRRLLAAFEHGKRLVLPGGLAPVLALPAARRRRIYDWLTAIAGQYAIAVHVCGCKNPDLAAGSCNFADHWTPPPAAKRQLALFAS